MIPNPVPGFGRSRARYCKIISISSRLRGTHCTTLHLNYTHKYSASGVLTAQHCVHVHARAPRPRSPPAARAPTGRARSRASPGEGAERAQDGGVTRRRARAFLCRAENRTSAGHAPRRGPTRGETRGEGAEAARGRCGSDAAPLGELGDAEQRAGTSSMMRVACRDGSN